MLKCPPTAKSEKHTWEGHMAEAALLNVNNLEAWYGESHVLHGVSFDVRKGEVVTLIGRNGAGKTTTLRSLIGVVGKRRGTSLFKGVDLLNVAPHKVARMGIGYVPEERGIFSTLSVIENLMFPPAWQAGGMEIDEIYGLFPNLKGRDHTPERVSRGRAADAGDWPNSKNRRRFHSARRADRRYRARYHRRDRGGASHS